jgi:molecular chaperone GrpE (heat shock protein)
VSACLKGPDFEKLRAEIETEAKATAVERLKAAVIPAADAWVRALEEAADEGDHERVLGGVTARA